MTWALTLNFRRPELTEACVRTLLQEGCERVLVWDNSDNDQYDTNRLRTIFALDDRVEIICSDRNMGFAAGVNAGLRHLAAVERVQRVLLINNDATLRRGSLALMEAAIDSPDSPVVVAPCIVQDGVKQDWMHYHRWLGLVLRQPWIGTFPYLSGCCLLVDVARIGLPLFDEKFFMYGEDVELSYRLRQQGLGQFIEPAASAHHLGSSGSGAGTLFYERQLVRCRFIIAEKIFGTGAKLTLACGLLRVVLNARAVWRSLQFRSIVPIVVVNEPLDRDEM